MFGKALGVGPHSGEAVTPETWRSYDLGPLSFRTAMTPEMCALMVERFLAEHIATPDGVREIKESHV